MKTFEKPKIEVMKFDVDDIITSSSPGPAESSPTDEAMGDDQYIWN